MISEDPSAGHPDPEVLTNVHQFRSGVLDPMKQLFVDRDEVIDLMGIAVVSRENLFLHGPPGSAKSALARQFAGLIHGTCFDYLLTRFTEPSEIFGPFDIRRLREGELITNTAGMLPDADIIFLDELMNANSAILNNLLMVLNEKIFRRGSESRPIRALTFIAASNRLPEDETLQALFDRFLLRVNCQYVDNDGLDQLLRTGWHRESDPSTGSSAGISRDAITTIQAAVTRVEMSGIVPAYKSLVRRVRQAGISISDRRVIKIMRLLAASAILAGRDHAEPSDLWVNRYIWDSTDQIPVINGLVAETMEEFASPDASHPHPRANSTQSPDPESIASGIRNLTQILNTPDKARDLESIREQLSVYNNSIDWISSPLQKKSLNSLINVAWNALKKHESPTHNL